jgi:hypothetical protein
METGEERLQIGLEAVGVRQDILKLLDHDPIQHTPIPRVQAAIVEKRCERSQQLLPQRHRALEARPDFCRVMDQSRVESALLVFQARTELLHLTQGVIEGAFLLTERTVDWPADDETALRWRREVPFVEQRLLN